MYTNITQWNISHTVICHFELPPPPPQYAKITTSLPPSIPPSLPPNKETNNANHFAYGMNLLKKSINTCTFTFVLEKISIPPGPTGVFLV